MQTTNFALPMLVEYQPKKDWTINSAMVKIDHLLGRAIDEIIDNFNSDDECNSTFILDSTQKSLHIKIDGSWHTIQPKYGLIFFVISVGKWHCFIDDAWQEV